MIDLGVTFGIIAMLAWGFSDFLAADAVKKEGVFSVFFWSQLVSMLSLFALFKMFNFSGISAKALFLIVITAIVDMAAYLSYYKAFSVGKASIISPIVSCWAVVTVIVSVILFKEKLLPLQIAGIALAIIGSVFISFKIHELKSRNFESKGFGLAVLAMLAWGSQIIFIRALIEEIGWFMPMLLIKFALIPLSLIYSKMSRQSIKFSRKGVPMLIAIGVLETIGFLAISFGIKSYYASIVAPISAAFPLVTIILARVFLKEFMESNQKIGAFMIIFGIVLLFIA